MSDDNGGRQKVACERIGDRVGIFKRCGRWYANFQHDGRQHRQSLRTSSKKEARRRAILIEGTLLRDEYRPATKGARIEVAIADYLAHLRTERRATKTIGKCELVCRRLTNLAARRHMRNLDQIDLQFVDAYRAERVAAGAKPKTVHNETVIIRQLINFALARNMLRTDPLKGLRLKNPKPTRQPCWTRLEVEKILAAAAGYQRAALVLLAETGARVGEIKHLTWEDIDLERALIHIRPKDDWQPKTGDQRAIPMNPTARELLVGLPRPSRWVITVPRSRRFPEPGRQFSERRLLLFLKRLLKRLGLKGHLHTFSA
jgi:integrase